MAQNSTIALLTIVVQRFYKSCWSWYWCINGASTAPPTPLTAVRIVSILHRKSDILLPAPPLCARARNDGSSIEERHRNQKKEPLTSLAFFLYRQRQCHAHAAPPQLTSIRLSDHSGVVETNSLIISSLWSGTRLFCGLVFLFWEFSTHND